MLGAAVTCVQSVNHDDEVRIQIMTMFLFQYCYPYLAKRYPVKVPVRYHIRLKLYPNVIIVRDAVVLFFDLRDGFFFRPEVEK